MKKTPEYIEYEDGTRVELDEDDSPEWKDKDFANAKKFSDLPPDLQVGLLALKKGRPKSVAPKQLISLRLDADIVAYLKNDVPQYNKKVGELLKNAWQSGEL